MHPYVQEAGYPSKRRKLTHTSDDQPQPPRSLTTSQNNPRVGLLIPKPSTVSDAYQHIDRNAELEAISARNQLQSPFLRLPGEIRNYIYHLALGGHEILFTLLDFNRSTCTVPPESQFECGRRPVSAVIDLPLLSVCRQVYLETGKSFIFAHNSFGCVPFCKFPATVAGLAGAHVSRIASVMINYNWLVYSPHDRLGRLKDFPGLNCVILWYMTDMADMSQKQKAEAITQLRDITGKENLKVTIHITRSFGEWYTSGR